MALTKSFMPHRPPGGIGLPTQIANGYSVHKTSLHPAPRHPALRDERADGYYSPGKTPEPFLPSTLRDIILQVKENADIVAIIGQYVPLKKAGARYLAALPVPPRPKPQHECDAANGHLQMLRLRRRRGRAQVRAGIREAGFHRRAENRGFPRGRGDTGEHPLLQGRRGQGQSQPGLGRQPISACQLYQEELAGNAEVLAYIAGRGISEETRKHFQLGLAPQSPEKLLSAPPPRDFPTRPSSMRASLEKPPAGASTTASPAA